MLRYAFDLVLISVTMNVLSDILCDTSSLITSQGYKISTTEDKLMSQDMLSRQGHLHLLDTTSPISAIDRPMSSINPHSSPSSIDLFHPTSQIHLSQNVDADFENRSESVFSDTFAEIVPSWLTHDFMKASDNLPSPSILSNVSDIYPSAQEDEHLEMLDLGFPPELSHDLTVNDLDRNCMDNNQKLLAELPMQRFSNRDPLLLTSFNNINVSQLHVPLNKNDLQYQKYKQSPEVNNSPNLLRTVLPCENELVHLPMHSDITSQCLTVTSSPSNRSNNQSHHNPVHSVCDKLPQINLNHLNSFLGNDISEMQLLRQEFPSVTLTEAGLNHSNSVLNTCRNEKISMSNNTTPMVNNNIVSPPLITKVDVSVQVSSGNSNESENCISCNKVDLDAPIEITKCFKCKFCDFISIHKCNVQSHLSISHSKSLNITNGTNLDQTSNIINPSLPVTNTSQNNYLTSSDPGSASILSLGSHVTNSIISSENTYIHNDNQVISKSSILSGHNLNSTPVQLSISESIPVSYQLIPIEGVISSLNENEAGNVHMNGNSQYFSEDYDNNLNNKQRPILKRPEDNPATSNESKRNSKSNKEDSIPENFEKAISAQKKGWQKKIKRELGSYICEFKGCNVRFRALDNLEYHRKCHVTGGNTFACPECGMSFNNWSSVAGHLWRNHSTDMELHACDICSFRTYSLSRLENYHKKTHLDECLFLCDTCGKKFKNRKQLRNHRVIHDKTKIKKPKDFRCNICGGHFTTKTLLLSHQDVVHNLERKKFLCRYCDYFTFKKDTMNLHMRQHTGEKPFECDKCEYKTSDHNSLRRHKMIHSGEKSYKCPYCPYSSIQANTYKDHLKRKHPGQNLVFSCELCSFRTVKYETFCIHMEEHESIDRHKQLHQICDINANEEMFPLVEAMGIKLSNNDNIAYFNNSNSQSFVNTVNMNVMSISQESSI